MGIDLNISNGSCWSNVNVRLSNEYIPCGNAADGNSYACCHYGDNCLSSNACYHAKFGITYLAGCTTQDFSGPACQNKGDFYNQPWVGLTRCDPDQSSWAGCPEKNGVVGSSPPTANCKCTKDTILFQDRPTLENIASLPLRLGGTISWFPDHDPTSTTSTPAYTSSTTFTRTTPSTTVTSISSESSAESSPPVTTSPPTAGLSVGEKAGIGIGSAFGAIVVGCLVALVVILWKRKERTKDIPSPRPSVPEIQHDPAQPGPSGSAFSVLGGFKAELPADGPPNPSPMVTSSIFSPATSAQPPAQPPIQSPAQSPTKRQYQPYRPGVYGDSRYSNVSQLSSATQGYTESLVSAPSPVFPAEPRKTTQPDTIHELG